MIFTIQAQEMFLEIDLTSLVLNINAIETNINSWKIIKNEWNMQNIVDWLNKTLISSNIKIKKRKFSTNINYTDIVNTKLYEWKDWIYITFFTIEWSKKYTYNFKLMNKINYIFKRKFLFFGAYEIVVPHEALRAEVITRTLNNWIKKYYNIKDIWWFNMNFSLAVAFLILLGFFSIWFVKAFGYLGM